MIGLRQMLKRQGFGGEIYDFVVDYTKTSINDMYNVHRYLMKKHDVKLKNSELGELCKKINSRNFSILLKKLI